MSKAATVASVVFAEIPSFNLKPTEPIIKMSSPDNTANCIIGRTIQETLPNARSIVVTPQWITFNALVKMPDGTEIMMRHMYPNPITGGRFAEQFDEDFHTKGIDYARQQAVDYLRDHKRRLHKDFTIRLQGRDATLKPLVVQPRGENRKPRAKGLLRVATTNDAPSCGRARYHVRSLRKRAA